MKETSRDHVNGHPQLSIIIVNHRSETLLPECLQSISEQEIEPPELIIVDNPLGTSTGISKFPDGLHVSRISGPGRIGFGAACNLGASQARGEYIMFLNPDVVLAPAALKHLLTALRENPKAAIGVGRLVGPDGEFQASCRRFPTPGNLFLSRGSALHRLFHIGGRRYTLPDYDIDTEVESAAAAMMMMSREVFDRLAGFDERFFLYMEDTDLCYRASELGLRIFYIPKAVGRHRWGYSTGQYRFRRIVWHHCSIWKYFGKHHRSIFGRLILGPALFVNCGLSLTFELLTLKK